MFRRVAYCGSLANVARLTYGVRTLTVPSDARNDLTKNLTALKEECKGQSLDLADMSDAVKMASQSLQDTTRRVAIDDAQFKGKMATLTASAKAYNTRLSNLRNEARSIQTEVDALMKLLWGTEQPQGASFSSPPPPSAGAAPEDFAVEPPPLAKALDPELDTASTTPKQTSDAPRTPPPVERVEAERVEDVKPTSSSTSTARSGSGDEEIEVETIEVEVEPPASGPEDPADTMKVTDITKELYEKGVNFADCLDARSLRQRYKDVRDGKIAAQGATQRAQKPFTEPLSMNTSQPRMPPKPQYEPQYQYQYQQQQQQQQSYQAPPNSGSSGLATDPYPNAERKMVDPMRYVWDVKQELAREKGIDPNSVDLWSGKVKLEEQKRLFDYPSIQNYPIEVRQRGDIPR